MLFPIYNASLQEDYQLKLEKLYRAINLCLTPVFLLDTLFDTKNIVNIESGHTVYFVNPYVIYMQCLFLFVTKSWSFAITLWPLWTKLSCFDMCYIPLMK